MTESVRDTIRAAVEPFGDDTVADALAAAAAVPQGDDPHVYAANIGAAVRIALEPVLDRERAARRRAEHEASMAFLVGWALRQPVPIRH